MTRRERNHSKRSSKRALTGSILAIVLCVVLLAGATFAWFTDTASTKVSDIKSGTLKIDFEVATEWDENGNPTRWEKAKDKTLGFVVKQGDGTYAVGSGILWEPGCTYKLQDLRVSNAGNLALKYKMEITGIGGDAELNDVIGWSVIWKDTTAGGPGATYDLDTWLSAPLDETELLPADAESKMYAKDCVFTIQGHMDEDAGNYYQGMNIDNISIVILATQYRWEDDSTGTAYDDNATYPVLWDGTTEAVPAPDTNGVITLTTAGQFVGLMENYSIAYRGKTIKLDCDIDFGGATISGFSVGGIGQFDANFDGQGHTISNFKIESGKEYMTGLFGNIGVQRGSTIKNLVVKDAIVIGKTQVGVIAGAINDGAVVENCAVVNCTVTGTEKVGAVVGYTLGSTVTGCTATDCIVNCADSSESQSAEIVGYVNTGSTVENNTATGVTVNRGTN